MAAAILWILIGLGLIAGGLLGTQSHVVPAGAAAAI